MRPKVFDDDDGDSLPSSNGPIELEVDEEYLSRLENKRQRDDARRYAAAVAEGKIVESEDDESDEENSDPEEEIGKAEVSEWIEYILKLKKHDPEVLATPEDDEVSKNDPKKKKKDEKKNKKLYLKDVQAQQLLEEGPDVAEEDEGGRSNRVQTYGEQQEELRRAVSDAVEAGGDESDDEDLLKVKERDDDDDEEEDEVLKEMADEYFGKESEIGEGDKFLRDYLLKQMWKDKDAKSLVIDKAELEQIEDDEDLVFEQEEFETRYRHEEKNAGEIVMSQSRIVEGSVRKKDSARKTQRKNREDRQKIAEIERQEELKRLKNVKKKEMKEKMKKVLSIAGFKDGEECPLDAKDLEDEFDPDEYDKMMKAVFDDNYYGAEDSELRSDEDNDDDEKPDFDKEDELLGLPKNWDVIQGGDGFTSTREKVLKQKEENGASDDNEQQEDEEEEVDEEEEEREGKRKRKRKTSLVKRAKEALLEEYYKLDYEDTIGDLKTRFKFAKVQPNSYGLEKEEILFLDDKELNQYVPLKKMAPYMEKDWEVNKYKFKEQKLKFNELLQRIDDPDEKRSKKKSKKRDGEGKRKVVEEKKPAAPVAEEEGEAETSKLSRKAKRRRREAEKKLPPNRMVAYGKTN